MLRLLGTPRTLCDGRTRREFLRIGGLGELGLGLSDALRFWEARAEPAKKARDLAPPSPAFSCFPTDRRLSTRPLIPSRTRPPKSRAR
jgi:hypothetical protein